MQNATGQPKTNFDRRRSTAAVIVRATFHAQAHLEVKRWRVRETVACGWAGAWAAYPCGNRFSRRGLSSCLPPSYAVRRCFVASGRFHALTVRSTRCYPSKHGWSGCCPARARGGGRRRTARLLRRASGRPILEGRGRPPSTPRTRRTRGATGPFCPFRAQKRRLTRYGVHNMLTENGLTHNRESGLIGVVSLYFSFM